MNGRCVASVLERLFRLGIGGLFVYSALAKIDDPGVFADAVRRYEMLPEWSLGMFALALPMLELIAGAALVLSRWTREAALVVACMLAMFIVALGVALARGLEIDCGCFGVPSVGGRAEMYIALVRDIVLLVPAVWLTFRADGWIWSRSCRSGACAALLCAVAMLAGQASGEAPAASFQPGEWSSDFDGVVAAAERERRPMLLVLEGDDCTYCKRLAKALSGEAFRLWRQDRAPLMVKITDRSPSSTPELVKRVQDFIAAAASTKEYPLVCVYWPRAGVTNRVAFTGRRGQMGVKKGKQPLSVEAMKAIDGAWPDYLASRPKHKTIAACVAAATRNVSVRADGDGKVSMKPAQGVLVEGGTVALSAKPGKGSVFVGWWRPDGRVAGWAPKLEVGGGMPGGCYVARFMPKDKCRPPALETPASTTLCVRARERFRYAIRVSPETRPVKFKPSGVFPYWIRLNENSGSLSGWPPFPATNNVSISVIGSDPAQTAVPVCLTLHAGPAVWGQRGEDDGKEKDAPAEDAADGTD